MSAPRALHAAAAAQLDGRASGLDAVIGGRGLSRDRRETFALRLDRYHEDLASALREIHPDPDIRESLTTRLVELAAAAYAERPDELHRLDAQRLLTPDWLQHPRMFGYACYTERFADDLQGVAKRLDHLEELGVTYLHLMPLLQPREGDNDGGYAVADYRAVRSDLGTMDDLRELATTLRERGISLCMDLVLNHVAREHEWAGAGPRPGDPTRTATTSTSSPTRPCSTPTSRRCRRCSPTSPLATSRGTTTCRAGSGRRSTSSSGTSTGPTRRSCWSSPRSSSAWPTWASRCCGWTRSRSSGSGWAPAARTSPRSTRSPRRCGRSPGSPRRRSRSRPRRSSARATWCSTSAPAPTPAGSATWPTTTA